ncbi:MAG: hypothetical protein LBT09_03800 [Planctomycetaceae bacterium]|jgi:hypothetical protein|nr:hypothetical protein [Planctomycetaceae bacterium]
MKKILFESVCNIFVLTITIAGTIIVGATLVFAQTNNTVDKSATNEELVPLVHPPLLQVDFVSSVADSALPREDSARLQKNSDSTSDLTNELQVGNELRKILARKPEISAEKIPKQNHSYGDTSRNFRNDNSDVADAVPQTIVLAQSAADPLASRPEPPQGRTVDLSAIPSALLNDPKTTNTNTNINPPANPQQTTNHAHTQNHFGDQQKDKTKNPPPTDEKFLNKNDLASVVNGWLLVATIVSVAALVYVAIIAVDYHQRWIQTLTAQNDRYFATDDLNYNNLTDTYDTTEKNRFGSDFFTHPAM